MGRSFVLISLIILFTVFKTSGQERMLEEKALRYFCDNINNIQKGLTVYNFQFSGKTEGVASDIFDIADCIGEISLIKNEIPNEAYYDSINKLNNQNRLPKKAIIIKCSFIKRITFRHYSYKLKVYNAITYDNAYYVEIFLVNKNRNSWVFCVKFNEDQEVEEHFLRFFSF